MVRHRQWLAGGKNKDKVMTANMHPQMKAVVEKNAEHGSMPVASVETVGDMRSHYLRSRKFWNETAPAMAAITDYQVVAPAGEITVRLYQPTNGKNLPVLLYCHGGGFVYGNLDSHDNICRQLASRSGWAVLAIDYHLAPEHKFPTPLADVQATIDWLDGRATELGLDFSMLAAGGDSAGAAIMLGAAMDLRTRRPGLLKQLLLIYGNYGLGDESDSMRLYGGGEFGLGPDLRKFFRGSYLGNEADLSDPRVAALKADLSGLPPVLAQAAEMDPLHDNSPALVEKLHAVGSAAEFRSYGGVLHGFMHYTRFCDVSVQAHDDAATTLRTLAAPTLASQLP
jgi:acetyl esterase